MAFRMLSMTSSGVSGCTKVPVSSMGGSGERVENTSQPASKTTAGMPTSSAKRTAMDRRPLIVASIGRLEQKRLEHLVDAAGALHPAGDLRDDVVEQGIRTGGARGQDDVDGARSGQPVFRLHLPLCRNVEMPYPFRRQNLAGIAHEVGGQPLLTELHEMARVRRVVAAHHDGEVASILDQADGGVLVLVGGVAERVAGVREMLGDVLLAIPIGHGRPQQICDGLCFGGEHRCLVYDADALQVAIRIESVGVAIIELIVEVGSVTLATNDGRKLGRLIDVAYDHHRAALAGMRERGASLLVVPLAVHHDRVGTPADLIALLPDFLDERAGRVVGSCVDASGGELRLDLEGCTEGRNHDDITLIQILKGDELLA